MAITYKPWQNKYFWVVLAILAVLLIILLSVLLTRKSSDSSSTEEQAISDMQRYVTLEGNLSPTQISTILGLVSIAENGDTSWWNHYNFAEDINDGRGITISLAGFCTGTGDFVQVVEKVKEIDPDHKLVKYLPALHTVSDADTTGLDGLIADIHSLSWDDYAWKHAVWSVINILYWSSAINSSRILGLESVIAKGELYDAVINHGPSGMQQIIDSVQSASPSSGGNEFQWLSEFLDRRQAVISVPGSSWTKGNPDRAILWRNILKANQTQLDRPLNNLVCYEEIFSII
jgi:chitosanase